VVQVGGQACPPLNKTSMEKEMKKIKYEDLEDVYLSVLQVRNNLELYIEMTPQCFTPDYLNTLVRRMFEIENKIDLLQNFSEGVKK
jgi:protein associated with RNAse G/E